MRSSYTLYPSWFYRVVMVVIRGGRRYNGIAFNTRHGACEEPETARSCSARPMCLVVRCLTTQVRSSCCRYSVIVPTGHLTEDML